LRRPDLLAHVEADKESRALLDEFRREHFDALQAKQNESNG
jgi:tRNA (guanine37-N1)-methyltransferase